MTDEELLARALAARGLEADPARIAATAPALRSLLDRLLRLREALPPETEPPAVPVEPPRS